MPLGGGGRFAWWGRLPLPLRWFNDTRPISRYFNAHREPNSPRVAALARRPGAGGRRLRRVPRLDRLNILARVLGWYDVSRDLALLGITILGVAGDQGKRRQIWLGAAIFGVSYMAMAFGRSLDRETWPNLPTDHLLEALRPWFPAVVSGFPTSSDGVAALNAHIWETLQRPVPMSFLEDTPLEDVLKHIQANTRGKDGKGMPIYVDPIGLQECEKSMTSTVRNIDFEGVPLKTSLGICLEQLDMTYRIRDGVLFITSEESAITPIYQDPFLIVGHCVLALLAAGFGGAVAPLFCVRRTAHAAL